MNQAFGGWVLDHHVLASWARVEPYAQSLVWSAMEVGMAVAVPVAALPLTYAATRESDHNVLHTLLELPVTLHDPLTEADAPALGRILADASDPGALGADALAWRAWCTQPVGGAGPCSPETPPRYASWTPT